MPDVVSQIQKLQLNTVQKGLDDVPQQLQSMSGKMPFPAAAPEEAPVSIVFNIPREDNEMQVQGNANGGRERSTATSTKANNNIGGRGVHDNNAGGIGKNGSSGQAQNTNGVSVAPGGGGAVGDGPLGGMPPLAASMMRPPNMMTGGAGFPGMYQMGGGPMDHPHNGNMQPGSGTGVAFQGQGMPAGGMQVSGSYDSYQGGAGAGRSVPSRPEMQQAGMASGNLLAQQQQRQQQLYMALMQQLGLGMSSGRMETLLTAMAGGNLMQQQYYTALMPQQQRDMSSPLAEMLRAGIAAGNLRAQQQFMAYMQQQQRELSIRQDELQAAMTSSNQMDQQYGTAAMHQQQRDMSWPETRPWRP